MSKPESWKQEGPLGDGGWSIEVTHRVHGDAPVAIVNSEAAYVRSPSAQHLRDFARALNRTADDLETLEPLAMTAPPRPFSEVADPPPAPVDPDLLQALKDSLRVADANRGRSDHRRRS
jgi:hypothetical protein